MNNSLNKDQQQLVMNNLGFAEHLAWYFGGRTGMDDTQEKCIVMDDLKQEALLGLCEAALRFVPVAGVDFKTVAYVWCRKYVLRAVRKYSCTLSVPDNYEGDDVSVLHFDLNGGSIVSPYSNDDGRMEDRKLYEIAEAEQRERVADLAGLELSALLDRALSGLTEKERGAIVCLYGLGGVEHTGLETARQLGIVPSRVTQIKERALRKLERLLSA